MEVKTSEKITSFTPSVHLCHLHFFEGEMFDQVLLSSVALVGHLCSQVYTVYRTGVAIILSKKVERLSSTLLKTTCTIPA